MRDRGWVGEGDERALVKCENKGLLECQVCKECIMKMYVVVVVVGMQISCVELCVCFNSTLRWRRNLLKMPAYSRLLEAPVFFFGLFALLTYAVPALLLKLAYRKERDLKRAYGAEWALVTGD